MAIDTPAFARDIETIAARRPAGMMVVAWDPSAVVAPIDKAIESGIPVICVDTDAPDSKRLSFIGTNWFDLGLRQGQAMVKTPAGRQGKVAMLGLTEHYIDPQAFAGFRSVAGKAGLTLMEPLESRYLNLPVKNGAAKRRMSLSMDGQIVREFESELAEGEPDFWVFLDISMFRGKKATLRVASLSRDWDPKRDASRLGRARGPQRIIPRWGSPPTGETEPVGTRTHVTGHFLLHRTPSQGWAIREPPRGFLRVSRDLRAARGRPAP